MPQGIWKWPPKCADFRRDAPPGPPRPSSEASELRGEKRPYLGDAFRGFAYDSPKFHRPDQCAVLERFGHLLVLLSDPPIGSGEPLGRW